jgi:hypothetical protein
MLQSTVIGLGTWAVLSALGASILPAEPTQAALAPFVTNICGSHLSWMEGFRIGERMPLASDQYHQALVISETPLREGYGFEGRVIAELAVGAQVTVIGETWDMGCNQWMVVSTDGGDAFVHGNALQKF